MPVLFASSILLKACVCEEAFRKYSSIFSTLCIASSLLWSSYISCIVSCLCCSCMIWIFCAFNHQLYKGRANLHVFEDWCGSSVEQLRRNVHYPLFPHMRSFVRKISLAPGWKNYGVRMFGFLHPYMDDHFHFAIASDDNSEFWLSTDEHPENLHLVAFVGKVCGRYYFEVLHKQNAIGMDHVEVAVRTVSYASMYLPACVFTSMFCLFWSTSICLKMNEAAYIPVSAAVVSRTSQETHSAEMLHPDPRDDFFLTPMVPDGDLEGVLPACDYNPSYILRGYMLERYQGLQFIHLSYVYPNDFTRLTHMEAENKCFYRENIYYLERPFHQLGSLYKAARNAEAESMIGGLSDVALRKIKIVNPLKEETSIDSRTGRKTERVIHGRVEGMVAVSPEGVAAARLEGVAAARLEGVAAARLEGVAAARPEGVAAARPEGVAAARPEGVASASPKGMAAARLEGVAAARPEGVAAARPEGVAAARPEGVAAARPEGVAAARPEGVAAARPEGVAAARPEGVATARPEGMVATRPNGEAGLKFEKIEMLHHVDDHWTRTFGVGEMDFGMQRSDWIDLHCNVSGNLLLHPGEAKSVVLSYMEALEKKHPGRFQLNRMISVQKRRDRQRGNRYLLDLEIKPLSQRSYDQPPLLRLSLYVFCLPPSTQSWELYPELEVDARGLAGDNEATGTAVHLCSPRGLSWKSQTTVYFVVPVKNQGRWVQQFIGDMEELRKTANDDAFSVVIADYSSEDMDIESALKSSSLPSYRYIRLDGNFERSAGLQAGVNLIKDQHSIVFLCDLHLRFPRSILDTIRRHCVEGLLTFAPIIMRLGCGATPQQPDGYWEVNGFGLLGLYKSDFDRVGGMNTEEFRDRWGGEDWELLDRVLQAGLEVERLYVRHFYHSYHSRHGMWNHMRHRN
uniref:Hexosyltransferase n=1 Tax=Eptatretus burgeri TaxID=7764 RepID=A0A8C4WW48_EPTBU